MPDNPLEHLLNAEQEGETGEIKPTSVGLKRSPDGHDPDGNEEYRGDKACRGGKTLALCSMSKSRQL
jgi:hypothetical protein